MNSLRIVKNAEGVNGPVLGNQCVLIVEETKEQFRGYNVLKYYMYNLDKNIKTEVAPSIAKHNIVNIIDINEKIIQKRLQFRGTVTVSLSFDEFVV